MGRSSILDPFVPNFDARERFQLQVRAPAGLVYETAAGFDFQSVTLVRAIFRLRERVMGSRPGAPAPAPRGFLAGAASIGWGLLREIPGRLFIAGAHCQPWLADVVFTPLGPADFGRFDTAGRVKIAWTLEVEPLDDTRCTLATETRAVATDAESRQRFRRYWRWARFGIYSIRWLLLPAIRREAEARYDRSHPRSAGAAGG